MSKEIRQMIYKVKNFKQFVNESYSKNYIESTYGNLTEKNGVIVTKSIWVDENNIKKLEYGFDPYLNEEPNTLFYYSWDFKDSGLSYDEFVNNLVVFFEKKYNKKVSNIKGLYVGWDRKENGTY
jgi:hypothetical protein